MVLDISLLNFICSVSPLDKYSTRPFLKWVRTQGCSPRMSGKIKKYLWPPSAFPQWGVPQMPGNKTVKQLVIFPCLTLSIIRYISRVKWSNPGKEVAPFSTPRVILDDYYYNYGIMCFMYEGCSKRSKPFFKSRREQNIFILATHDHFLQN